MKTLLGLALRSAWNRRLTLGLTLAAVALSSLLLLGVERIRADLRASFAKSVSGVDLVAGARGSPVQLMLYSVFRMGEVTQNMSWGAAQWLAQHPAVAWSVPVSLGDSHRGYPVLGTTPAYFDQFRYGERRELQLAAGKRFDGLFEAVLGAEVAERLALPARREDRARPRQRRRPARRSRGQALRGHRHPGAHRHAGGPHRARQRSRK